MNVLNFTTMLALLAMTVIGQADPLDTWIRRGPLPPETDLTGIGYGGAQFVAVGERGNILTSADGTNWVQRQSGTTNRLSGITFGNGKFLAVGSFSRHFDDKPGGAILTSIDGVDWIQSWRDTTNGLVAIAYGNGQFLALGPRGYTMTSSDGLNWVHQRGLGDYFVSGIAYGDGKFVISGFVDAGKPGFIPVSVDGANWSGSYAGINNDPYKSVNDVAAITYGNGQFVGSGTSGQRVIL